MKVEIFYAYTNQWVDITPYIAWQGISFSRNDIESPKSGRDMAGLMHRGRVAIKEKIEINTVPLTRAQSAMIQNLLIAESFQVRITPYPRTNQTETFTMYSNNVKVSYVIYRANGEDIQTLSFPLVEM
jgi:hypothetical protein